MITFERYRAEYGHGDHGPGHDSLESLAYNLLRQAVIDGAELSAVVRLVLDQWQPSMIREDIENEIREAYAAEVARRRSPRTS